jgi:hypothetical protein
MKLKKFIGEVFMYLIKNGCFGVLPKHDSSLLVDSNIKED